MRKLLLVFMASLILISCATQPNSETGKVNKPEPLSPLAKCVQATGQTDITFASIHSSPNSLFADKIAEMVVRITGSNSVDGLYEFLTQPQRGVLLVGGLNASLSAATLEAAVNKLPANSQKDAPAVCIKVPKASEDFESLKSAAQNTGLNLIFIPS